MKLTFDTPVMFDITMFGNQIFEKFPINKE